MSAHHNLAVIAPSVAGFIFVVTNGEGPLRNGEPTG